MACGTLCFAGGQRGSAHSRVGDAGANGAVAGRRRRSGLTTPNSRAIIAQTKSLSLSTKRDVEALKVRAAGLALLWSVRSCACDVLVPHTIDAVSIPACAHRYSPQAQLKLQAKQTQRTNATVAAVYREIVALRKDMDRTGLGTALDATAKKLVTR